MDRQIVAFRQDDEGVWVADLACGHSQHIRHNPPFRLAPWVLDEHERQARIGADLECRLCDQADGLPSSGVRGEKGRPGG
jgi:hypothetical protein